MYFTYKFTPNTVDTNSIKEKRKKLQKKEVGEYSNFLNVLFLKYNHSSSNQCRHKHYYCNNFYNN